MKYILVFDSSVNHTQRSEQKRNLTFPNLKNYLTKLFKFKLSLCMTNKNKNSCHIEFFSFTICAEKFTYCINKIRQLK